MTPPLPDIAALIGSRICHDLISPVGAISNGVELLEIAGGTTGPEIDLISQSARNANARIRFFRIAFGAATPDQRIGSSEVNDILADYSHHTRLEIDWQVDGDTPRLTTKIAFLLILCLETSLPWGGQITVRNLAGHWSATAEAGRIRVDDRLWDFLTGRADAPDISPAEVQFLLLSSLLADAGLDLALTIESSAITAQLVPVHDKAAAAFVGQESVGS